MNLQCTPSTIEKWNPGLHKSQIDMVAFQLDHQVFTLPIEIIYQIIDMVALTPLPEENDTIEGIFNYHGTTVPVVDLRRYLTAERGSIHLHTPILLVAYSGQIIGLIVDKVLDVLSFPRQAIQPPEELLPENLGEIPILDGVIQSSENFLLLLNLGNLFSQKRQINLAEALSRLSAQPDSPTGKQKPGEAAGLLQHLFGSAEQMTEAVNRDGKDDIAANSDRKERQKAVQPGTKRQASPA